MTRLCLHNYLSMRHFYRNFICDMLVYRKLHNHFYLIRNGSDISKSSDIYRMKMLLEVT